MKSKIMKFPYILGFSLALSVALSSYAAPVLPSSADAGRLISEEKISPFENSDKEVFIPKSVVLKEMPEAVKNIKFILKEVKIEGMTVFTTDAIKDIYIKDLNQEVSLAIAWEIANKITTRYRNEGYFLSRAYIPEQKIKDGTIKINIIEGYIAEIELPEDMQNNKVIKTYADKLLKTRPATIDKVEEFVLKVNDLPGYSCRSVLSPIDKENFEGEGIKLTLVKTDKKSRGMISYDNNSSRYLGINEVSSSYSTSLLPMHQTTISGMSSLPTDKSNYGGIDHLVVLAPDLTLGLSASTTKTYPGYTLDTYDIDSSANSMGMSLNYQWIRQRQENLSTKFMLNSINVTSNILGTALTRDHVRVLRSGFIYNKDDKWQGQNQVDFTLSRGIAGLGSSQTNDLYLSRISAKPNFTKAELSLSRTQEIYNEWSAFIATSGQYTSNSLYSSEQFGYGGQNFGRAYDPSEITGDKGIKAVLELRYSGLDFSKELKVQPFSFYDIGSVTDNHVSNSTYSAASAGLGIRFATIWNQNCSIGVAWPLTKDISTPIYGTNHRSPRFMMQFSQSF
ncbi:MAG: ShlB/FhaC/HecB family hemolysin secretion/activation protein [Rickettsiales bacterium]